MVLFGKTVYFPGIFSDDNIKKNYRHILDNIKVKYVEFDENIDIVSDKKKFLDTIRKKRVKKIITNCPHTLNILNKLKIKSEHISLTIKKNISNFISEDILKDNLKDNSLQIENKNIFVSYHDPCFLGRYSGIYETPRIILKSLGYEVIEFDMNKKNSFCCGANMSNKYISEKICSKRLATCKTRILVTSCPLCYRHFKKNAKDILTLELSEAILKNAKK